MKQILLSIKIITSLSFLLIGISSCEIINPIEDIPYYLRIDSISFMDSTNIPAIPSKEGVHQIKDAWVFVDGIYMGTYEMPNTIPIFGAPGSHEIIVSPGILISAQNGNRQIYPFFTNYKTSINVELGNTVTVQPKISYDPTAVKFPSEASGQLPEEFEGVGTIFKTTINSDVDTIIRTDNPALVFDGNFSMLMEMDATKDFMEFETDKAYSLPNNARPVYMEVNYRANVYLNIGLYVISNDGTSVKEVSVITMLPTNNEWKKLYLNLTDAVSSYSNSKYKVYFKAAHDSGNTSSQVLIDNFRVMYK
jgi:hypothetical protein